MAELLYKINQAILNPLLILLIGIAFVVFLWGIVEFLAKSSGDEAREKGKRNMLWGLFGMFVMIAVFGIIRLVLGTFGITEIPGGLVP